MNAVHVTGHCYCGAIRFAVDIPEGDAPIFTAYCHCDSCRRAHAAPLYHVAWQALERHWGAVAD
jgi:hypothetical protein